MLVTLSLVTRWPLQSEALDAEQKRLATICPPAWIPPPGVLRVAGCFAAFRSRRPGPGEAGDRGWAGATVVEFPGARLVASVVVPVAAGGPYDRGRLARREGQPLTTALAELSTPFDVVLVDATGRDHPRGAGLALHIGAVLDVPTIGVTHRPLVARGEWPLDEAGASTPLLRGEVIVGAWLRTRKGARPLAVHAAWRTDVTTAVEVVRRCVIAARTPEPLREARRLARTARARAGASAPMT